jgi:hypothetical protein
VSKTVSYNHHLASLDVGGRGMGHGSGCAACSAYLANIDGPGTRVSSVCTTAFLCAWCVSRWADPRYFGRPGHPCETCASNYPWLLD